MRSITLLPELPWAAYPRGGWGVVLAICAVPLAALAYFALFLMLRGTFVPFADLPGPPSDHWFYGNFMTLMSQPSGVAIDKWFKQYGPTFRWTSIFRRPEIISLDPAVASYIWTHPDSFERAKSSQKQFKALLGESVISSIGAEHRRMRRALLPAFSVGQIKNNIPVFWKKAYQLKAKMIKEIGDETDLDLAPLMNQLSVDIIGLAGFDHDFDSLGDKQDELLKAFEKREAGGRGGGLLRMLQFTGVPFARLLPSKVAQESEESKTLSEKLSRRIYDRSVERILGDIEKPEKEDIVGTDLISVLIRSNMAVDVRPEQKVSDDEIIGNMFTFILAGNITTSKSLTWALHALATHQDVQRKLRQEVSQVIEDEPDLDQLNELPYLEAVVHELLRMYSIISVNVRQATKDAVIPLSRPVKGRNGRSIDSLRLSKGTTVLLPILNVNTSTEYYGDDAETFRPERFLDVKREAAPWSDVPGVYGNIMTFTSGTHACLGFRFAIAEMKVVLFMLLRSFAFDEVKAQGPVIRSGALGISEPKIAGAKQPGIKVHIRPLRDNE